MAKLLSEWAERDKAHTELEKVRRTNPFAECRENLSRAKPYQVWDGKCPHPDDPGYSTRPADDDLQDEVPVDQVEP